MYSPNKSVSVATTIDYANAYTDDCQYAMEWIGSACKVPCFYSYSLLYILNQFCVGVMFKSKVSYFRVMLPLHYCLSC